MSWGDPYDSLYKDDGTPDRCGQVGFSPGDQVKVGELIKHIEVWTKPDITSDMISVSPGLGIVLAVDCESDSLYDRIMVLLTETNTNRVLVIWTLPALLRKP